MIEKRQCGSGSGVDLLILQGIALAAPGLSQESLVRLSGVQIIEHGNFEVHQLCALGIIDTGNVDMCAGEWRRNVVDIKKEKSRLRAARLDRSRGEHRPFNFVFFFLTDCAFHFFVRDWKWNRRIGAGFWIRQPAVDVVRRSGGQLGIVCRGQSYLHVGNRDRLSAVVGDNEKNRQESVLMKVNGENLCFFCSVIRIGCYGDFFIGVVVMRGIGFRGLGDRLGEILGCDREREPCDSVRNEHAVP